MVNLAKDPKGENIFERSNSQPSFMSGNHLDTVDRERVSAMTAKIMELEGRLRKYEVNFALASKLDSYCKLFSREISLMTNTKFSFKVLAETKGFISVKTAKKRISTNIELKIFLCLSVHL